MFRFDSIQFKQNRTKFLAYTCPNADCRHVGTNIALTSPQFIEQVNDGMQADYLAATANYNRAKKEKKNLPTIMGKLIDQQIRCYCFLLFCNFLANDGNCPNCQNGGDDIYQVCGSDGKEHCTCVICSCQCCCVFDQIERHTYITCSKSLKIISTITG